MPGFFPRSQNKAPNITDFLHINHTSIDLLQKIEDFLKYISVDPNRKRFIKKSFFEAVQKIKLPNLDAKQQKEWEKIKSSKTLTALFNFIKSLHEKENFAAIKALTTELSLQFIPLEQLEIDKSIIQLFKNELYDFSKNYYFYEVDPTRQEDYPKIHGSKFNLIYDYVMEKLNADPNNPLYNLAIQRMHSLYYGRKLPEDIFQAFNRIIAEQYKETTDPAARELLLTNIAKLKSEVILPSLKLATNLASSKKIAEYLRSTEAALEQRLEIIYNVLKDATSLSNPTAHELQQAKNKCQKLIQSASFFSDDIKKNISAYLMKVNNYEELVRVFYNVLQDAKERVKWSRKEDEDEAYSLCQSIGGSVNDAATYVQQNKCVAILSILRQIDTLVEQIEQPYKQYMQLRDKTVKLDLPDIEDKPKKPGR